MKTWKALSLSIRPIRFAMHALTAVGACVAIANAQTERGSTMRLWDQSNPSNYLFLEPTPGTATWGIRLPAVMPAAGGVLFSSTPVGSRVPLIFTAAGTSSDVLVGGTTPTWSGANNLFWRVGGNSLSGPDANSPTQRLGSTNPYDVIFQVGSAERMRIKASAPGIFLPDIASTQRTLLTLNGSRVLDVSGTATSGSADANTFLGIGAGNHLTTGIQNVAIGPRALGSVSTGSANIAIGRGALLQTTTTGANIAIGSNTMLSATTGANANIAIGQTSLFAFQTGDNNIVLGTNAAADATTGRRNLVFGESAMRSPGQTNIGEENITLGYFAGWSINGSIRNIIIGSNAGQHVSTGSYNTFLGFSSGFTAAQPQRSYAVAIGPFATVNRDHSIVLGAIAGVNSATTTSFVGIGTRAPSRRLEIGTFGTDFVAGVPNVRDASLHGPDAFITTLAGVGTDAGIMVAGQWGDHYKANKYVARSLTGIDAFRFEGDGLAVYNNLGFGYDFVPGMTVQATIVYENGGSPVGVVTVEVTEIDYVNDDISIECSAPIDAGTWVHFLFISPTP